MKTNPYQVLGPSVPSMLGRAALIQRLGRHLLKPSPDHVSIVGPAHYGKSVLLQHVAGVYRTESSYVTAAYMDLRRRTPASDREFMQRFAEEIRAALEVVRAEIAEWIESDESGVQEVLGLVLDELVRNDERLLVVFDGFDYALAGTGLTRNLWDQLRALAQKDSLRLVTGSRRPLRELCRTEDSRTSDFWEIFYDTPIRVTALDDADVETFLQPLSDEGCEFDESARKEISNWTGRVPLLLSALLHALWEDHRGARLSKPSIDAVGNRVLDERRQLLAALWDDCDDELRADLGALSEGDISLTELSNDDRRGALEQRGFGHVSRNRMRSSCLLMKRYAEAQAPAVADLTRLMGTTSGFEVNVRSLLDMRLAQVAARGADERLRYLVGEAIRALAPVPENSLIFVRKIASRALTLIWDAELPDGQLPAAWRDEWDSRDVNYAHKDGQLPDGFRPRCNILRLATGTEHTSRVVRHITRTTYLVLDHLLSVGNFGQHSEDYPETKVTVGFAASVVFAAISLVECLTQDLAGDDSV